MLTLVVPCYNEAERLRTGDFLGATAALDYLRLLLVDDGSGDRTREVLEEMARANPGRIQVLAMPRNSGKAEAVRRGMLHGLNESPDYVGYWDADLATPFDAVPDFMRLFESRADIDIVMGSRVQMLGRAINRSPNRHYAGRVFATSASIVLGLPVYDTQCGAKVFRNSPRLRRILDAAFKSRWIFDVELLARYLDDRVELPGEAAPSADRIYELALKSWVDEPGSKVRTKDGVRAFVDLLRIYRGRAGKDAVLRSSPPVIAGSIARSEASIRR